jgi:hypothetical protein
MTTTSARRPNQSLHRTPDASVTRLAFATRAPVAGVGELNRYAARSVRVLPLETITRREVPCPTIRR